MTFRSLICEEKQDDSGRLESYVSMGRITFWLLFLFMAYFWFHGLTVPPSLLQAFNIMVLYNFLKKPLNMINPETLGGFFKKS
jgi:hypothetical protein